MKSFLFLCAAFLPLNALAETADSTIVQHHWCCGFDSLRLPNDSAGYPGLTYDVRGTTPSVLRFLSVIHHIFWREKI